MKSFSKKTYEWLSDSTAFITQNAFYRILNPSFAKNQHREVWHFAYNQPTVGNSTVCRKCE